MLTADDIINLKNRLAAAKKAPDYNDRQFVDVPMGQLEQLIIIAEINESKVAKPRSAP